MKPQPLELIQPDLNQSASERYGLLRIGAIVGIAAILGAGCKAPDGGQDKPGQGITNNSLDVGPDVSPTDAIFERIFNRAVIEAELGEKFPDIEAVRKRFAAMKPGESSGLERLQQATDVLDAKAAVSALEANHYMTPPEKAREQLADISDPKLMAKALAVVDVLDASSAVSALEANHYMTPPEKAREQLADISDQSRKKQAEEAIDALDAAQAVSALDMNPVTTPPDKAIGLVEDIQNPDIKAAALNSIEAYKRSGDRSKEFIDQHKALDKLADEKTRVIDSDSNTIGSNLVAELDKLAEDSLEASTNAKTVEIKEHNALIIDINKPITIEPLATPQAPIDLSKVKGKKQIPNILKALNEKDEIENLAQFAEVFAENGKIHLRFENGHNLSPQTLEQLTNIIKNVQPLVEAGYASGDLVSIRFIASDDYNPYFVPKTHEIYMVLPSDNTTSMDQLRSGLVHETVHSLTRSVFASNSNLSPAEATDLKNACTAVRNTVYDGAESLFRTSPQLLINLRDEAKPEHRPFIDSLIKAISEDELEKIMDSGYGEYSNKYAYVLNDCNPSDLSTALMRVGIKSGLTYSEIEYLFNTESYAKAADLWYDAEEFLAVYRKFNESAYVDTQSVVKEYLGHSEDRATEQVASVADAAISFTDKFGEALRTMSAEDKDASIKALQISFDLIANRHPSLKSYLIDLEVEVITAANL